MVKRIRKIRLGLHQRGGCGPFVCQLHPAPYYIKLNVDESCSKRAQEYHSNDRRLHQESFSGSMEGFGTRQPLEEDGEKCGLHYSYEFVPDALHLPL